MATAVQEPFQRDHYGFDEPELTIMLVENMNGKYPGTVGQAYRSASRYKADAPRDK